jgi:hypothetical protein
MLKQIFGALKAVKRGTFNTIGTIGGIEEACYRCNDKLNWKAKHHTSFGDCQSCHPLCEECWRTLKPDERLPFYRTMVDKWFQARSFDDKRDFAQIYEAIKKSVLAGN